MSPDDLPPIPVRGCEVCNTTDTVTVDGICGRRCSMHAPTFDATLAARIAAAGWVHTAMAYCRSGVAA